MGAIPHGRELEVVVGEGVVAEAAHSCGPATISLVYAAAFAPTSASRLPMAFIF